ncbi:hypothetical protein [Mucilaginibacter sp.]|jgi:transcriptional regulator GlxA family with amidase domain|uniref:hypothetical protein n=1 Tax=Mucilaginibacter sp. TaxID=1882438 RepID=UPI0035640C21
MKDKEQTKRKLIDAVGIIIRTKGFEGGRITTAGISAGIDGVLHLVAKLKGKEVAEAIAKQIEYDKYVPEQGMDLSNKR